MIPRFKHKFGARSCSRGEAKFRSKLERSCWDLLEQARKDGRILFFLRETRFDLPANKKHYVDFTVFTKDDVIFIESKGVDHESGKLKREMAESLTGAQIHVVKKANDILPLIHGV